MGTQPLLGYGSHSSIFSPTDLNFLSPGLYNNLTLTYFLRASQFRTRFNPSTVKVAPDLLISSTGCTCYLRISSFDSLAGVNMQQLHMSDIVPKKMYLQGILLHYFIQKKSAYRILVETYSDLALSETTRRDWFRRFKNNDFVVEDKERSGTPKSLKMKIWRDYFMKIHVKCKMNLQNH